ncbi:hypothetical protein [uncultured Lacinutrix sp.]|uniref:hypothetical protein n=1 Tax=uncultured Lacinutrix sp. TaxID=574032 RepID=UPI00260CACC1|nr:hypothetical protein [uncultured Lacinutrix sp.]
MRIFIFFSFFLILNCDKSVKNNFPEGVWFHAYELSSEDLPNGALIYRSTTYFEMPPARYRHFFKFINDKSCETIELAVNDRHKTIVVPCNISKNVLQLNSIYYKILSHTKKEIILLKK